MILNADIKIAQTENGRFEISHPSAYGNVNYELPENITTFELAEKLVRSAKLPELVILCQSNALTQEAVSRLITGDKITVLEAFERWKVWMGHTKEESTAHTYASVLSRWVCGKGIQDRLPGTLTEMDITNFVNPDSETKASTRALVLAAFRSFFQYCTAKGYCYSDPSKIVRVSYRKLKHEQKERRKTEPFTEDDVKHLLNSLDIQIHWVTAELGSLDVSSTRARVSQARLLNKLEFLKFWKCAVTLSDLTSLRISDVVKLEWASWGADHLIVWTEKKDTRVEFPMVPALKKVYNLIPLRDLVYCFPEQRVMEAAKLSTYFKRLCEEFEIDNKTFHGIRKGAIQRWSRQGLTLETVAAQAGHSNSGTTERYYLQ